MQNEPGLKTQLIELLSKTDTKLDLKGLEQLMGYIKEKEEK